MTPKSGQGGRDHDKEADMSLLDVLNGMQNGPRGQSTPGGGSGGISPITMAALGLIAYKAIKSFSGGSVGGGASPGANAGTQSAGSGAGGLADLLKSGLGSI